MGRHREFDPETALDSALRVFWAKGYEGTSYDDLVEATGVKRPGLYAAFGNKEELFRRVLARFRVVYASYMDEALAEPTPYAMAEHALRGAVAMTTRFPEHRGCLGVSGALACSDDAAPIRELLVAFRTSGQELLRERLEQFQKDGALPASASPAGLAAYLMAVIHGMAVQAKSGMSRKALDAVVTHALAGFAGWNRQRSRRPYPPRDG